MYDPMRRYGYSLSSDSCLQIMMMLCVCVALLDIIGEFVESVEYWFDIPNYTVILAVLFLVVLEVQIL